jgi:hypothetical protein
MGLTFGCSASQPSDLPGPGAGDDAGQDGSSGGAPDGAMEVANVPVRCGADAGFANDEGDPTVAVTDWVQVQRYNCAHDESGQVVRCQSDSECPSGRVCDTSANCGCCVTPPPTVDSTLRLHRALYTPCTNGHCEAPRYCTPADSGRSCAMSFDGQIAVWGMRHEVPANACPLGELRRALCMKVEPTQACLWLLDVPGGSYRADEPFPTDYTDIYECGGRTCNGAETFRIHPNAGVTFVATLIVDNC